MRALGHEDPRTVGTYRVLRVLGSGGMGRVYVGRSRTGRIVAIKVILPGLADDPGFRGRFRREVEAARRVGGAWTAPVLDADTEAERPWLVTGYVPGMSLGEAVAERGPLPSPSLRALAAGLAEALAAVHQAGVVHRDLKPSNVMLSPDGPRVIDFGISRAVDASVLTGTGLTVGSPGFMSPEQIDGSDIGPAADVFALGAVLAFAATGGGPFGEGNSQALIYRILTQEPRLDGVPDEFRPIVTACLAKAPADRPTPHEVLRAVLPDGAAGDLVATGWLPPDLANAVSRRAVALLELEDEPSEDAVPSPAPPPYVVPATFVPPATSELRSARRRPAWPYAALAFVVIAAVVTAVILMRGDDGDRNQGIGNTPSSTSATGAVTGGQAALPPASPPPHATGEGALPGNYVGTWAGTATDGLVNQTVTVTLRAGNTGSVVGTMKARTPALLNLECWGESRLLGIDAAAVRLEDVPGTGSTGNALCSNGGEYTLQAQTDGTLLLTTASGLSGRLAKSA